MQNFDYFSLLGLYLGEAPLDDFLATVSITKKPKIPRDDIKSRIASKAAGLDFTFTDSAHLDFPPRDYPDGAVVLSSIIFNLRKTSDLDAFKGTLPKGISQNMSIEEVKLLLGKPAFVNEDSDQFRWDFDHRCMFVGFNSPSEMSRVSILLHNRYTKKK